MKSVLKQTLVGALLFAALFACAKKHTDGGGLRSLGDLNVNGPQIDGSVHASTKVLYTLKEINENQNYTLRTEIGLRSDGSSTSPDGTLTVKIYTSADAFRNNPDDIVASPAAPAINNPNIYEINFKALPNSSGDYVVVLTGNSESVPGIQFFYNLRLMSADPTALAGVLTAVTSNETGTTYEIQHANPLNPGFLNIYNGVASLGTSTIAIDLVSGTINLVSNATTTIANPQIFMYLDSTLTVSSLMLSSIPTTTELVITSFNAGIPVTTTKTSINVNTNVISNVTFTGGGPFIVLKGVASAVTYTLTIGP
ncbi:MAG TPA: hypothetical protein VF905_01270 [Nitrospirota bacterium]